MPISEVFNMDCMEYMKDIPDNFFDLAVVDPPYGIGASDMTMGKGKNKKYQKGKKWDSSPPNYLYFEQLFRVSINQIIWGGAITSIYQKPGVGFFGIKEYMEIVLLLMVSLHGHLLIKFFG